MVVALNYDRQSRAREIRSWLMPFCMCLLLSTSLYLSRVASAASDLVGGPADSPFHWHDERDTPVSLAQWNGKTILLTMAYSTCREVCSYTLHRLLELQESADRAGTPIEVVVISYDPKVDGARSWSIYRQQHHLARSNWHFLTGTALDTQRFASTFDFRYWRYDDHVVHDFRILLLSSDGTIAETLDWETRNKDLFARMGTPETNSIHKGTE